MRQTNALCADQLAALLRAALWQKPADTTYFESGTVDWRTICQMAQNNTVAGLTFYGVSMSDTLCPPKPWFRQATLYAAQTINAHSLLNSCLAEATKILSAAGITPVLLKGQAYASIYPEPIIRNCGDIDLYVGEKDFEKACATAKENGWESLPDENTTAAGPLKHYGCYLHGVHIELHRKAAILATPWADRKFQKWSRQQLESTTRTMDVQGTTVTLPTPIFDIVFVFEHLFGHFIGEGVGLRQLCDWTVLLHHHAGAIEHTFLKQCLNDFGLLHAWMLFAPITVQQLGLPEHECPLYNSRYSKQARKIFKMIVNDGNFGLYSPGRTAKPANYWLGKLHSFRRHQKRYFALMPLFPSTIILTYFRFIYTGFRRIFFEIFGDSFLLRGTSKKLCT